MRSPVAGKARVHELAKELGVESKVVLARLKEMGEFVKSASSTVEAPVARRLKEMFPAGGDVAAAAAAASARGTRQPAKKASGPAAARPAAAEAPAADGAAAPAAPAAANAGAPGAPVRPVPAPP